MPDSVIIGGAASWYMGPDGTASGLYGPDGTVSPIVISSTYANALINYPAATNNGRVISMTDLNNCLFRSNGTRYIPVNRNGIIGSLDVEWVGAASAAEQISFSRLLPASLLANGDILQVTISAGKSGTSETLESRIRLGTTGTTADTTIQGPFNLLTATSISIGWFVSMRRDSATTIRKLGSGANTTTFTGTPVAVATAGATTVSDMGASPMYLTFTSKMSVGAEAPTIHTVVVELLSATA